MSIESANAFVQRMRKDPSFRRKVIAAEDKEARMALAKSEGFDFTKSELNSVLSEWDQCVEWLGVDGMLWKMCLNQ